MPSTRHIILNGQMPEESKVLTTPVVWDNVSEDGTAALTAALDPTIDSDRKASYPTINPAINAARRRQRNRSQTLQPSRTP